MVKQSIRVLAVIGLLASWCLCAIPTKERQQRDGVGRGAQALRMAAGMGSLNPSMEADRNTIHMLMQSHGYPSSEYIAGNIVRNMTGVYFSVFWCSDHDRKEPIVHYRYQRATREFESLWVQTRESDGESDLDTMLAQLAIGQERGREADF